LSNDELLRPTLADYRKPPSLYHSTGFFVSAFFGGPVGAGLYAGANAWRLGRLSRDLPVILAVVAAALLGILEIYRAGMLQALAHWLGGSLSRNLSIIVRTFGIATFGAIYLAHRRFFRAAQVSGVKPLPGWLPGIVATSAGYFSMAAFTTWILEHH
jgi:hypothetical protein